jgi:hypothetical protein
MQWRGIKDFGCGALGDMAVHNADPAYFALDLGAPDWVDAETSPPNADSFPAWTIVTWHFPAKGSRPAITMKWYDGGKRPANVPFVDPALNLGDNGLIIAGSKAALFGGSHASPPRLLPSEAQASTPVPPKSLPRSPGHRIEWVRAAIAGNPKDAMSGFWYSAPFTESLLTGMLAVEFQKRLTWDAAALRSPSRALLSPAGGRLGVLSPLGEGVSALEAATPPGGLGGAVRRLERSLTAALRALCTGHAALDTGVTDYQARTRAATAASRR